MIISKLIVELLYIIHVAAENYAQNGPKADPTVPYNQSDAPSSAVVPAEYHREPGSGNRHLLTPPSLNQYRC